MLLYLRYRLIYLLYGISAETVDLNSLPTTASTNTFERENAKRLRHRKWLPSLSAAVSSGDILEQ